MYYQLAAVGHPAHQHRVGSLDRLPVQPVPRGSCGLRAVSRVSLPAKPCAPRPGICA